MANAPYYPVEYILGATPKVTRVHTWVGISVVVALVAWEASMQFGFSDRFDSSAPSLIFIELMRFVQSGDALTHILGSVRRVLVGVGLGVAIGFFAAILCALSPLLQAVASRWLSGFLAYSRISIYYMFIIWYGIGDEPKILTIVWATALVQMLITLQSLQEVLHGERYARIIDRAVMLDMTRWQFVRYVLFYGALPSLFTGWLDTVARAWTFLVFLESVGGVFGVGILVNRGYNEANMTAVITYSLVLVILNIITHEISRYVQKRVLY